MSIGPQEKAGRISSNRKKGVMPCLTFTLLPTCALPLCKPFTEKEAVQYLLNEVNSVSVIWGSSCYPFRKGRTFLFPLIYEDWHQDAFLGWKRVDGGGMGKNVSSNWQIWTALSRRVGMMLSGNALEWTPSRRCFWALLPSISISLFQPLDLVRRFHSRM